MFSTSRRTRFKPPRIGSEASKRAVYCTGVPSWYVLCLYVVLRCVWHWLCCFRLCAASRTKEQNIVQDYLHGTFCVRSLLVECVPLVTRLCLRRNVFCNMFPRPVCRLGMHAPWKILRTFMEYCNRKLRISAEKFKLLVTCTIPCAAIEPQQHLEL